MPADGWWNNSGAIAGCVLAYQAIGAASLAASYVNLRNPGTYDASPGDAPTFNSATGWTFNGTSDYLTTGYAPPNQTKFGCLVRYSNADNSGSRVVLFVPNNGITLNLGIANAISGVPLYANRAQEAGAGAVTAGVLGLRSNADGSAAQGYKDGATDGAAFATAAGSDWKTLLVGAYNGAGDIKSLFFGGDIQALTIYDADITEAELQTITTAMAALTGGGGASPVAIIVQAHGLYLGAELV